MTAPSGPLVSTAWLYEHLTDPDLVVLEVDEQPLIYGVGHIPGARNIRWRDNLQASPTRDIPDAEAMQRLWKQLGITTRSTVVLYGDKNNWYACFAFWLFRLYGLTRLALLDGGRQLWLTEGARPRRTRRPTPEGAKPPSPRARRRVPRPLDDRFSMPRRTASCSTSERRPSTRGGC